MMGASVPDRATHAPHEACKQSSPSGEYPSRWPHTQRAWRRLKAAWRDLQVARLLERRCKKRDGWVIRRVSDGTLWTEGSPQNFAYAMRGLMLRGLCDSFHFYRVREWQGILVASRRVFWRPQSGEFTQLFKCPAFHLPAWPEFEECRRIDAAIATETRQGGDAEQGSVEDEGATPEGGLPK